MDAETNIDRKIAQAKLFAEVKRGTPMGTLLRQFWHPVARVSALAKGKARPIRILSEDLTLYRGESGAFHLVAARCAHRGTLMHTGWVEGEQLRCMYHGWRYDGSGECTEIPAEKERRARMPCITAYPTREYAGLVFAYMGEGTAPSFDLLRKPAFEDSTRHTVTLEQTWDCHWFHQVENSLDPVHLAFAHRWGKLTHYAEARKATAQPELTYWETTAGVRQRFSTGNKDKPRISDWTFPNCNHLIVPGPNSGDPWSEILAWIVPIDEENTLRFRVYSYPQSAAAQANKVASEDPDYEPALLHDALFNQGEAARMKALDVTDLQFFTAQDYVAMRGQGVLADRVNENLSVSDAGVLYLRKLYLREMEAIQAGRSTKTWTPLAEQAELPMQTAEEGA